MAEPAPASSLHIADPELEYRSVERWAVCGLLLGMFSPLGLVAPLLWLIGPLGVLANVVALRRLNANPNHIGRKAALLGLGLSVLFGAAPVAETLTARALLTAQGRAIADEFFEHVRSGSPEKAVSLEFAPDFRQQADDDLWDFFRRDKNAQRELTLFVRDPTARALLELGDRAEIRFYKTASVASDGSRGLVNYWYTVTYDDDMAKKKTFLVRIVVERRPTMTPGLSPWRVNSISGGIDPDKARY